MMDAAPILIERAGQVVGRIAAQRVGLPRVTEDEYAHSVYSQDGGYPRADPMTTLAGDGTIYVGYQHPPAVVVHKSVDGGRSWQCVAVRERPKYWEYGIVRSFGSADNRALVALYTGCPTPPPGDTGADAGARWMRWSQTGKAHFARSEDGGETWQYLHEADLGPGTSLEGLGRVQPLANGTVIAVATPWHEAHQPYDRIWRSTDVGRSFRLDAALPEHSAESHILQLNSGSLLAAMRTVYTTPNYGPHQNDHPRHKRMALTRSDDDGKTWSPPQMLTTLIGDCPGELIGLGDGRLVFLYCHRYPPRTGIYGRVSHDQGQTWQQDQLVLTLMNDDQPGAYPSSVLLDDQTIVTVQAQHEHGPAQAIRWKLP